MDNIVIGIEGLVGAGKTSICRRLIKTMPNTILLNGGNLYRTIVYAMMQNGADLEKLKDTQNLDIKSMMHLLKVEIRIEDNETRFYICGNLAKEEEIQSKESSIAVSTVGGRADNSKLFEFAKNLINDLKQQHNVIISGRSIMQIYPNTDYHFFVTADLDERVRRKCLQYKDEISEKEVRENIIKRDELQEKAGFYKLDKKTITIDVTDCKTIEESTNKILDQINYISALF